MRENEGLNGEIFATVDEDTGCDENNASVLDVEEVANDSQIKGKGICPDCGRQSVAGPIVCKGLRRPGNKGRLYKLVSDTHHNKNRFHKL